jgi:general secretion pathway protein B
MSLILDALKRAERERNADAVPAPGEVAVPRVGRAPAGRRGLWIGTIVAAIGVAGFSGWKLTRGKPAPEPAPQPAPAVIVARPAPPPAQPVVVPGTEAVASLDDLTDEPILDAAPGPETPLPAPAVVPAPAASGPAAPAPTPAPAQPASAAPTPQTTAEVPAAPAEIPPALTQPAPLRKFREMPPEYRADFPALKIEVHVHEAAVQRRFVMVNGRRYREGERLAEGPQLVEIVAEGMVLEYRGEKVLYTLGR